MRYILLALAPGLAFAATPLAAKKPVPPAVVTGPPVNCILVQNIRNTRVIDDRTIDFQMRGRQVYRNNLPASCPQLGFQQVFSYELSIPQLCSVDIITVLIQGGGMMQGARCGLGKFTPIEPPARK